MPEELLPPTLPESGNLPEVSPGSPGAAPVGAGRGKSFGWFWLLPIALILVVLALGFYIFYSQKVPSSETVGGSVPVDLSGEMPASAPETALDLTGSDSLSDIEKDLDNTVVGTDNQDFADLQTDLQGL